MTFFFTMIFVFFVFWRPQDWLWLWMAGWSILDLIMVFASGSFVLELVQGQVRIPWRRQPQLKILIGFFFATLMSHVANTYLQGMIDTIAPMLKLCFVTFVLCSVLDRPSRLRGFAVAFVLMACVMAFHALMQQRLGYGFMGSTPLWYVPIGSEEGYTRSLFFGIFGDPNDLAQFLATSLPFAFVIFRRRSFLSLIAGCLISWLLIEAILATHSRGGLIALVSVLAVMFVVHLPARLVPTWFLLMGFVALLMCSYATGSLDESAMGRLTFWGRANWLFKENPIFGIGCGMFWMVADARASHNAFVSCYTELGVFGYWFWFLLIHLGVVGAWRTIVVLRNYSDPDLKWLGRYAGMSIAAMVGFSTSAYFLSRTYHFPYFFLMAISGALPVVANRVLKEEDSRLFYKPKDIWLWGSLGVFGSIFYIYFTILLLNKLRGG